MGVNVQWGKSDLLTLFFTALQKACHHLIVAGDSVPWCIVSEPMSQSGIERDGNEARCSFHGESFQDLLGADPTCPRGVSLVCHHLQPALHLTICTLCPPYCPVQMPVCWGRVALPDAAAAEAQRPPGRSPGRLPAGASEERSCEGPHQGAVFLLLSDLSPGLVAGFKNSTKGPLPTKDF